jgi:hypothetical protein
MAKLVKPTIEDDLAALQAHELAAAGTSCC